MQLSYSQYLRFTEGAGADDAPVGRDGRQYQREETGDAAGNNPSGINSREKEVDAEAERDEGGGEVDVLALAVGADRKPARLEAYAGGDTNHHGSGVARVVNNNGFVG